MSKEHVVLMTSVDGKTKYQVDINNGYVYDEAGNQIARWAPKQESKDERNGLFTARFLETEVYGAERKVGLVRKSVESALRLRDAHDLAKAKSVLMDLGTGDVHQPSPLTNYASGYSNWPPMADVVSAPILVDQVAGKYYEFDKDDAFQAAVPIAGAPAGTPMEVSPRIANSEYSTQERALGGFVSTQITAAADAPLKIRQATARRILGALLIQRERRVQTLLTTTGSWNSAMVATLAAGEKWNGGASSDPVANIHARMEASLAPVSGMVMHPKAFNAMIRNPNVQKYFTYKDRAEALPTPDQMSALLQLPPIYLAAMKEKKTAAGTYGYVWDDDVVLFTMPPVNPPQDQESIATSYTFRWKVAGSVDGAYSGPFIVREFFNNLRGTMGGNQMVVVHHDDEVMTSGFAGGLIKDVIQ